MTKGRKLAAVIPDDGPPSHLASENLPSEPTLDRTVQARIGDNLRAMYDELLRQPVPDRFKDLIGQLEHERKHKEQSR
ncbi:MAG TPA: NepR family anti-sigma factor [Beijerinckiaceae bacterium]|jgi:hypothetical protein